LSEASSPFAGEKAPASPRADLITAAVFLAFGLGIVALSLRMPSFVEQSGTGLTAPGIVPGFHGSMIALLAILLGFRAIRRGGWRAAAPAGTHSADLGRLALAAALGTAYAGFLVGRLPFWLASALFVFAFTACFEWHLSAGRRLRRLLEAAAIGLATGLAVALVFERIFLVRLP